MSLMGAELGTFGNMTLTTTSNCDWNGAAVYPYQWYYQTEPISCIGKAHVFDCEHVKKCKCGAVERVMAKGKSK